MTDKDPVPDHERDREIRRMVFIEIIVLYGLAIGAAILFWV